MSEQLARGLWTDFAAGVNPFDIPNGMTDNLRLLDDHLSIYTLAPPQDPATPYPENPANGDGQIYTDGTYAVFNRGEWVKYPARKGISAATVNTEGIWLNSGDQWILANESLINGLNAVAEELGDLNSRMSTTVASLERSFAAMAVLSRPAFLEQHLTGFFGRGMLTSETINISTEQTLVGDYAAGAVTLVVTDAANFVVGGCATVKHDNGKYGTYFVDSKSGNNIGIRPSLRYSCSAATSRIERTWFNRAHPGKFYMRELAQRIAHSSELDAAMPNGRRLLYTNVSSDPNTLEDTLIAVGNANINYFAAANTGESGSTTTPVRFALGRTAYVENILATTDGCKTQMFDVADVASAVVKVALFAEVNTQISIQVFDEANNDRGTYVIPSGVSQKVSQIYTLTADLRGAKRIYVRIASENLIVPGGYFAVGQIDVFEAPVSVGKIISRAAAKIVCLGDSWISGDLASTSEREPITAQLALELPDATIINAGVGGNTLLQMLERFDTDVASHNPDYVVINTGTNDSYNPAAVTFDPDAITAFLDAYRRLINKIQAVGARAIIIGVPALAQSDAEVPAAAEWTFNDRARVYARRFFEWQSALPFVRFGSNANGDWTRFDDGTFECQRHIPVTTTAANTLAHVVWNLPINAVGTPKIETTISDYSSNQLVSVGADSVSSTSAAICVVSGTGPITVVVNCIAKGRWRA